MRLIAVALAASLTLPAHSAQADLFKSIGKAVIAPVTAPLKLADDLRRGAPPREIVQHQLDLRVKPQGEVIQQSAQVLQQAHTVIQNIPRNAIQSLGGDWLKAYDTLTAGQRIQAEMMFTGGRYLGACLVNTSNCDPRRLAAMPVAAAMRDAYKTYLPYSVPLDPQTKYVLSRVVPMPVLEAARLSFGKTPDMTVPGFLNFGHSVAGNDHAVTLANLMIFSRPPNLQTRDGLIWLLHELFHVEQYFRYSGHPLEAIDGFAVDYIQHYGRMEDEAQNVAVARFNQLMTMF
jgi:hypothetical protein